LTLDESKESNDQAFEVRGIRFLIDKNDLPFLKGTQLDSVKDLGCNFIIAEFSKLKIKEV
jgi:Fe-S cluster assembly iron-binding protein IscA